MSVTAVMNSQYSKTSSGAHKEVKMSMSEQKNIGGYITTQKGTEPANQVAGTVNGAAIDRAALGMPQSATLVGACGAASGTPTAQSVDFKLQHSDASGSGYADLSGAAVTQMTADDQLEYVDVDLSSAKRYIRVVEVVAFTGGSTPAIPTSSQVILGGAERLPLA